MEKKRNGQTIIIAILAVAILFMSVGFAVYATTLNINGDVEVDAAKWDIHWDSESYTPAAGSVKIYNSDMTQEKPDLTNTGVTFKAKLTKPEEYAEFSIDAVNAGTFDAKLKNIKISPVLTEAQKKYLTYTVTYNGNEYEATTNNLSIPLNHGDSNRVTVSIKVKYEQPADPTALPQNAETLEVNVDFDYEQV